ncbi:hypothetical protein [Corynebacterium cystitidis]|uniref:Uncharacterized protein n=1 Tax=Corynebacterium cystitidis DSM 20524 TaxID=1121357 RepID=A0A1H9VK92_9CORY|nr:hypothetical protein [Corynebacterium cystitidis]WJY81432.1 hypothetical protein CCYS_02295 [Corynebacterium cystitidis DSM 20524]SES21757.1 hypothetical protein SAMN05661109_02271 [Corynebacterium cystitidis DSM 20524]SNV87476.1 Uncharacterised protein [Corynebacterium cystitidis]
MSDFLAERLKKYSIQVTGISPYGFGTAEMFWDLPSSSPGAGAWEDVTELTQGVPPEQSGVMLLRDSEPVEGFHQNVATYTWVLDGHVPFELIFTNLKEPVPVDARQVSSLSAIEHASDRHAEARLVTRFSDDERDMVSTTVFTWYKLDGTGTRFDDPSVLIQRTLVAVDQSGDAELASDTRQHSVPGFRPLPDSVDKLGR